MEFQGGRFLLVGGAGLIGSHTLESLLEHDIEEAIVYDNFARGTHSNISAGLSDPRVRVWEAGGDIGQTDILSEACKDMDGVFHFAALWLLQCYEYPRAAFDVNVRGTFNVLEACVANDVKRLVYSSSASVYGEPDEDPIVEAHPFNNRTFYGATKIAGEAMCRAMHDRYGLSYVGLRYMNVYGPRQDYKGAYIAVIMKMLDSIDKGEPITIFGDGSQAFDFVYVGDCAQANIAAMKAASEDQFYNVGSGVKTSIRELAELVLDLTASDVGVAFEPEGLTFVRNRIGSTEKASRELGFDATVPLREGLIRLIEWRSRHKEDVDARRTGSTQPS